MNDPMYSSKERGQSLVLIALAAIVLVAFVALAVDGSQTYSQRRVAQNAGDGAAVAGAYRLGIQIRMVGTGTPAEFQRRILRDMHAAAELHGLPDTNGIAGDEINGNLQAFFTDDQGTQLAACQVGTCTTIPEGTLGLRLQVRKEFDTYFAGVIGWDEATIGASALAVVHAGAVGEDGRYWAIFADDTLACNQYEGQVTGSTIDIIGNVHSNGSFKMQGASAVADGQITYVDDCLGCNSAPPPAESPSLHLEYPNFNAYRNLAMAEGTIHPGGTVTTNMGSASAPITRVTGNVTFSGTNQRLTGLIFVQGNVRISGEGINGAFTIVAEGEIDMVGSAKNFNGRPYSNAAYPLLARESNVALFFTNASGSNPCNTPIIKISGSQNRIRGCVMAPNGRIDFSGSSNQVAGCLLGDQVDVSGSSNRIEYDGSYFPPQPDRVELIQ